MILFNIISLTRITFNMDVDNSDTNAKNAKNLMSIACAVGYVGLLFIIIFVIVAYIYSSNQDETTKTYYEKLMGITGAENLYVAMRVVSFSIMMFISVVIAVLCKEATDYIDKSNDPSQYDSEYNACEALAELFMRHFAIFTVLQGISYLYQIFYKDGTIKMSPTQITDGKKK